jgi:hypothetical protein
MNPAIHNSTRDFPQMKIQDIKPKLEPLQAEYKGLPLTWSDCNYGGFRPWFRCPKCDRRIGVLYEVYRNTLHCRHCANAVHHSTRESAAERWHRKLRKFQEQTGHDVELSVPMDWSRYPKPWAMRRTTYRRLILDVQLAELQYWGHVAGQLSRRAERMGRILVRQQCDS